MKTLLALLFSFLTLMSCQKGEEPYINYLNIDNTPLPDQSMTVTSDDNSTFIIEAGYTGGGNPQYFLQVNNQQVTNITQSSMLDVFHQGWGGDLNFKNQYITLDFANYAPNDEVTVTTRINTSNGNESESYTFLIQ